MNVKEQFKINLLQYIYSVDPAEIGENRAVVAVCDDENSNVANPYAATESITILIGSDISSTSEAERIATSIGMGDSTIVKTERDIDVRYVLKECTDSLTIYLALICTKEKSFPTQFFFNNSLGEENESVVLSVLRSINVYEDEANTAEHRLVLAEEGQEKTDDFAKQKVDEIVNELKKRYPAGSELPKSFEELKFFNSDLPISTLNKWTIIAYGEKARAYLVKQGLLAGYTGTEVETPQKKVVGSVSDNSQDNNNIPEIPSGVLYRPGEEPERIRQRMDRLFEKLNSAYLYKNAGSTVVIPEGVTKICANVFKENTNIKTVVFPSTLTEIGEEAFSGCPNLTAIDLPNGILRLDKGCFYRCRKIKQVSIPDSLIEIGRSSFNSCDALAEVNLGANVKTIGEKAFLECKMLRTVHMNDKLRVIGPEAFEQCTLLRTITLPETVTEIGNGAFRRCEALESINIPDAVTTVQSSTFEGCKSLANIKIHDGIAEIQSLAFHGCVCLESVSLPAQVGEKAFARCSGITTLTFNEKMTSVENNCFNGCVKVTAVVIPEGVETLEAQAFYGCSGLETVILPETLKTIGASAFYDCSSLKNVVIPNAVSTIGDNAFKDCASLENVTMADSIPNMGIDVFTNTPYMKKAFGEFVVMGGVLTKYLGTDIDAHNIAWLKEAFTKENAVKCKRYLEEHYSA